jgi:hypothetical protein
VGGLGVVINDAGCCRGTLDVWPSHGVCRCIVARWPGASSLRVREPGRLGREGGDHRIYYLIYGCHSLVVDARYNAVASGRRVWACMSHQNWAGQISWSTLLIMYGTFGCGACWTMGLTAVGGLGHGGWCFCARLGKRVEGSTAGSGISRVVCCAMLGCGRVLPPFIHQINVRRGKEEAMRLAVGLTVDLVHHI